MNMTDHVCSLCRLYPTATVTKIDVNYFSQWVCIVAQLHWAFYSPCECVTATSVIRDKDSWGSKAVVEQLCLVVQPTVINKDLSQRWPDVSVLQGAWEEQHVLSWFLLAPGSGSVWLNPQIPAAHHTQTGSCSRFTDTQSGVADVDHPQAHLIDSFTLSHHTVNRQ